MQATAELYLTHGLPESIFPAGCHVFPASLPALQRLSEALREDFGHVEHVSEAELATGAARPLRLPALRAFLATRDAELRAHWREPQIRRNTLAHAAERLAALERMNAPDVVLNNAQAVVAELSGSLALPALNLELLVPDACGAASLVDNAEPRYVEADVSSLVLLAALTCVEANAESLQLEPDVTWRALWDASEPVAIPGSVAVRPAVYERVQRLEMAEAATAAPGGALLLVEL